MAVLELSSVVLAAIIGTLLAIIWSLKVLIRMERRAASMEINIQRIASKILSEEEVIKKVISRKAKRKKKR